MSDSPRARKLADQIKRILAERLQKGLRDPDLGYVTITDVRVSGDLQHATVFFTVLGSDEERDLSFQALKRATGMLRTEVGRHLRIRLTPTLEFVPDALPETAGEIERLLGEAKARDEQLKTQSQGAHYAGDEHPYREDDEA